jgi:hypothetical protein
MPILRDLPITLTAEELLAERGRNEQRSGLIAAAQEAIALGQTLFAPAAIYERFDVHSVAGERVALGAREHEAISQTPTLPHSSAPLALTVGPRADLLAPAQRLLVAVYTIGPALEARVGDLTRAGEPLLSYLLDCAGVTALGVVGERVRCLAEELAVERGWGVSPALSPGSLVGWTLQGQQELCSLLPIAEIGVRLNEYCVLEPHKSVSVVIGMGPGYESHEVGSVCRYCALRDSCWRYRSANQQVANHKSER